MKIPVKPSQTPDPWITANQAAEIIGEDVPTIWKWIRSGRLPSSNPIGRSVRIRLSAAHKEREFKREYIWGTKDVAKFFSVNRNAVTTMIRSGLACKRLGKDYRFRPVDCEKYMESREINTD